jgi:hypothetical protein
MAIARKHPVANWLLLPPHEQRKALDTVMRFRDAAPDPMASGLPAAAVEWFWQSELPRLLQRPEVRRQVEAHVDDLVSQQSRIAQQIEQQAPALMEQLQALQAEVRRLEELLS